MVLPNGGFTKCCGKSRSNSESSQRSQMSDKQEFNNDIDDQEEIEEACTIDNIFSDIESLEERMNKKLENYLIEMNKTIADVSKNLQQIYVKRVKEIKEELKLFKSSLEKKIEKSNIQIEENRVRSIKNSESIQKIEKKLNTNKQEFNEDVMSDCLAQMTDRESRKNNVIIFNVPGYMPQVTAQEQDSPRRLANRNGNGERLYSTSTRGLKEYENTAKNKEGCWRKSVHQADKREICPFTKSNTSTHNINVKLNNDQQSTVDTLSKDATHRCTDIQQHQQASPEISNKHKIRYNKPSSSNNSDRLINNYNVNFLVYYQNVRGLNMNRLEFERNSALSIYNVILVTETWFKDEILSSEVADPDTFSVVRNDRAVKYKTRGGGVMIIIRKNIKYKQLTHIQELNN